MYSGLFASVCLLIAVMVFVRFVAIGIKTIRLLCLTSKLMLWICIVLSIILFGICFLQGRTPADAVWKLSQKSFKPDPGEGKQQMTNLKMCRWVEN